MSNSSSRKSGPVANSLNCEKRSSTLSGKFPFAVPGNPLLIPPGKPFRASKSPCNYAVQTPYPRSLFPKQEIYSRLTAQTSAPSTHSLFPTRFPLRKILSRTLGVRYGNPQNSVRVVSMRLWKKNYKNLLLGTKNLHFSSPCGKM